MRILLVATKPSCEFKRTGFFDLMLIVCSSFPQSFKILERLKPRSNSLKNSKKKNEMKKKNKAGYTVTEVACGCAGIIFKVTRLFGQEQ